jgi:hypothetical protein
MKATIIIEAAQNKIDLLISIAHEMGISVISTGQYKIATDEVTHVSEPSLSEAWDSEEDKRWDKLYNTSK